MVMDMMIFIMIIIIGKYNIIQRIVINCLTLCDRSSEFLNMMFIV